MSLDVHLHPNRCQHCGRSDEGYWANITHNLTEMARAADIYYHLWRPEEIGITKAAELIKPLSQGLKKMRENPAYFKQFDSPNGWGTYEDFVPWIQKYLDACIDMPDAEISVDR